MSRQLRDFTRAPWRGRFEAFLLDGTADTEPDSVVRAKQRTIGAMRGAVVEVGPGPGTNMRYYAAGVSVVAIEPNPAMHERLRSNAADHDVDLQIRISAGRALHGEQMDLPDASVDAVVGTLLLCGVDDPSQVVAEIRRVLRPGGKYFFYEHVAAPAGSVTAVAQRLLFTPHKWVFNGCEVNRDTGALLGEAGFAEVSLTPVDGGLGAGHTRSRIIGTATA